MHSYRCFALFLVLGLPAMPVVMAQSSSSSSSNPTQAQSPDQISQNQGSQPGAAQQPSAETQGQISVEDRLRLRREQRRATAIHEAYDHRWETFASLGYQRFQPGPYLQRTTYFGWETGLTRFTSERLGYTLDARGYTGIAFVGITPLTQGAFTRPKISEYDLLFGPTYRFYLQPKYSIAGRVLGGWAYGNFSGDTNGEGSIPVNPANPNGPTLLYPTGSTFAVSASVVAEYNLSPNVGFRLAPEYFATDFSSTIQNTRGFTAGVVYRFGKQ
jgi:hypothetical protein